MDEEEFRKLQVGCGGGGGQGARQGGVRGQDRQLQVEWALGELVTEQHFLGAL